MGGFGCRLGKDWYDKTYAWNKDNAELIESRSNTDPITFGFDCICMLKSLWWGFDGDTSKPYGSAVYASNGVADMSIASLKKSCSKIMQSFCKRWVLMSWRAKMLYTLVRSQSNARATETTLRCFCVIISLIRCPMCIVLRF